MLSRWEKHSELRHVGGSYPVSIEAIGDVYFRKTDRAQAWVGVMVCALQHSLCHSPKLHSFWWHHLDGVLVDPIEIAVACCPGLSVSLWHHTNGTQHLVVVLALVQLTKHEDNTIQLCFPVDYRP